MNTFTFSRHRHTRYWAVHDPDGKLICVCLYKRGAIEVTRLLSQAPVVLRENPPETGHDPGFPLDTPGDSP